jgi:hypothetical protein
MPPRLRANDYSKGRISQDEIIALQIANDANISRARKAIKMGELPQRTEMENASPMELLADDATQEATARTNVMKLGFRDREAAAIITNIRGEASLDFATFNANFPAIEADIKKRFNVKLITPTFFIEYLKKYSDELADATGVKSVFNPNNAGVNNLVNTIAELRQVIPDPNVIEYIRKAAQESRVVGQDTLNQLEYLKDLLPNARDLQAVSNLDPVSQQRIIDQLLVQFQDMPSEAEIRRFASKIEADQIDRTAMMRQILDIVNSIPKGRTTNIIEDETGSSSSSSAITATPLTYEQELEEGRRKAILLRPSTEAQRQPVRVAVGKLYIGDSVNSLTDFTDMNISNKKAFLSQVGLSKLILDGEGNKLAQSKLTYSNIDESNVNKLVSAWLSLKGRFGTKQIPKLDEEPELLQEVKQLSGQGLRRKIAPNIRMKVGRGLAVKETPSYREYGKYAIHIPQLEQQDILNVKYKSLGQIPKFKPIPVSDIFRDFVLDLIENGKPNARVYTQICPNERKFFEEMSIGAGIWNSLGLKRTTTSTDEEENKRFELLKGEYVAGNNSPKVISELRKLVVKMMSDGRIRKNQGVELLMELSI